MGRRERRLEARKLLTEEKHDTQAQTTSKVGRFFDKNYHKLQLIPLIIILLAIGYNAVFFVQHGDFVRKGVSLAGGTAVSITTSDPVDTVAIEKALRSSFPNADLTVQTISGSQGSLGFAVDAANVDPDPNNAEKLLVARLKQLYPAADYSTETTGPSLGSAFFVQTMIAIVAAFVLMAIVVFASFRTFYPSMAVVAAGFSTVVSTLAVFNLLGFQLSTAGVAAFLMLIGYSIDTDILLSTRVLKGTGPFISNVWSAAKTGLTMQVTTATTVTVILFFSINPVFTQIMTIILIGMFFDVLYTWVQNAAILKWYVERKERAHR